MKLSFALSLTIYALTYSSSSATKNSLRGVDEELTSSPFDILKCSFQGKADKDTCAATMNSDGQSCSFCSFTSDDGQDTGVCVDVEIASQIKQMKQDVTCTNMEDVVDKADSKSVFSSVFATSIDNIPTNNSEDMVDGPPKPFDVLKCSVVGRTDKEKCAHTTTKGGEPCSFCSLSENGNTAGLCVDPQIGDQMMQVNPDVSCTNHDSTEVHQENEINTNGPFDLFKCAFAGMNKDKCSSVDLGDDRHCSFCVKGEEGTVGVCASPAVADQIMKIDKTQNCTPLDKVESATFDPSPFKCTIEALGDEDKCFSTKTAEEMECEYCTMNGPFGKQGICVSPTHAEGIKGLVGDNVSCAATHEASNINKVVSLPIKDCNLGGTDKETCLDPSKVNGSECIWCDAGIGGFCFPKSWEKTAGRFLKCGNEVDAIVAIE